MNGKDEILYIVMPAYNEGENIQETVDAWIGVLDGKSAKSRLVVADSGSTDDTHAIPMNLKKKYDKLEILEKTNQFHGPKVIALYKYAIKCGATYVFQTDSDGQTNPEEFDAFWKERNQYDIILGQRSKRGDGKIRAFVEKVVCLLLKLFFGVSVPDANAPFRLMNTKILKKYIKRLPDEYDLPNIILTAYFVRFGEKVKFNEISFKPRTAGVNSVNIKKIFRIGRESLRTFSDFRKDMKSMNPSIEKANFNKRVGSILIVLSFVVMALLAISTSPSSPWNRSETITDSGVFLTVGTQMKNGLMPYRDTFDHKGPVLYIINYLGVLINETSGIIVFEFLALLVAVIFMYKIARLKIKNRYTSLFLTFIIFSLYLTFNIIDRGNLTEEYAMPFIAISLFYYLKYLMGKKVSYLNIGVIGFCFACVLMLRVNMVSIWAVFSIIIFVKMLLEKKFSELWKMVLSFLVGTLVVILPIFAWLFIGGAFSDFIDVYLRFNMSYAKTGVNGIVSTIAYFLETIILFLSAILTLYYNFIKKSSTNYRLLWRSYLCAFVVAVVLACMSGRNYPHYGMVLIPLTVFPFAALYSELESNKEYNLILVVSLLLISVVYPAWLNTLKYTVNSFSHRQTGELVADSVLKPCELIEQYTSTSDKIVVYGNRGYIYLRCNRLPASRYSYQFPIAAVRPKILEEFFDEVAEEKPKVFIVQAGYVDDGVLDFLNDNNYKEEWRENSDLSAVGNESGTRVYVLAD